MTLDHPASCPVCGTSRPKVKLQVAIIGPDGFGTGEFMMIDKAKVDLAVQRSIIDKAFRDRVGGYTIVFGDGPVRDEPDSVTKLMEGRGMAAKVFEDMRENFEQTNNEISMNDIDNLTLKISQLEHRIAALEGGKQGNGYICAICGTVCPDNWYYYEVTNIQTGVVIKPICAPCVRKPNEGYKSTGPHKQPTKG